MMHELIYQTIHLRKEYETQAGDLSILRGINFQLCRGELMSIVGRSGIGKSTFLHLLGGLDRPTSGEILFEGVSLENFNEAQLCQLRLKKISYIFQFYHLLPELTVLENVMLPMMIAGKADPKWAREMLRQVNLLGRRDHYPSEISGGEKQRVAIARALVNRPSVILCDEPTGNLDEETAEDIYDLILNLNKKEGQSFVLVTHDEKWAFQNTQVMRLHEGLLTREPSDEAVLDRLSKPI